MPRSPTSWTRGAALLEDEPYDQPLGVMSETRSPWFTLDSTLGAQKAAKAFPTGDRPDQLWLARVGHRRDAGGIEQPKQGAVVERQRMLRPWRGQGVELGCCGRVPLSLCFPGPPLHADGQIAVPGTKFSSVELLDSTGSETGP
jgi:hypothetical protein